MFTPIEDQCPSETLETWLETRAHLISIGHNPTEAELFASTFMLVGAITSINPEAVYSRATKPRGQVTATALTQIGWSAPDAETLVSALKTTDGIYITYPNATAVQFSR